MEHLMAPEQICATARVQNLLAPAFHVEVTDHVARHAGVSDREAMRQVTECLRYLFLVSRYRSQLGGLFLPVEQCIDDVWHYLILQTNDYRVLCEERLPGRYFIHHRSLPYDTYRQMPDRARLIEESLRWIPLYTGEFGSFEDTSLPYWTMPRFLHQELGMSLRDISSLRAEQTI
jgi:hypothetical protein